MMSDNVQLSYPIGKFATPAEMTQEHSRAGVSVSLTLIDALHERWVQLLRSMTPEQFTGCAFIHPERPGEQSLARATGLYAWHGRHHTAHITSLRERMGW